MLLSSKAISNTIDKIEITGNDRITDETIRLFISVSKNDEINDIELNNILNDLYETNFFKNIVVNFKDQILLINVEENPIIENVNYNGIKSNRILDLIKQDTFIKSRSSFNENLLKKEKLKIENILKNLGYYNSNLEILVEETKNNLVIITYNIDLGKKSKIKKITFIGNKVFKDKKLHRIITSSEYKFWKFISGRKYLNQNSVSFDERLLQNFYKNNGYYNVKINSSFAKLIDSNNFELIFNINSGPKVFFGNLDLDLPSDFDEKNFSPIIELFIKTEGKAYSINQIDKILDEIDTITTLEQYKFIKANVTENIEDNLINLKFTVEESEKIFVDRINITGNTITAENVIRNQLLLDEGDPFSEILVTKSINNIKSLNFFKKVGSKVIINEDNNTKTINISVEEKPTGEIYATAGAGTSGGSFGFGVKENNFLGNGIGLDTNFELTSETFKGKFSVTNPNFNNTDKTLYISAESSENDNYQNFGYKTNKTGLIIGTNFEYLNDFYLGLSNSNFYEVIRTNSTASAQQQAQEGNYWDSFIKLDFNYDKRNQKFQTNSGFRSFYSLDLPILSDTNTLKNYYNYDHYFDFFENNFSSISFYFQTANSLNNKDIKLSERINIPSSRLRGFERGRVGPKDGDDFIGGNYAYSINFASNVPFLFEESQKLDFLIFADAADIWGVDYDSSIKGNGIRSSIGVALDWMSPLGPMNFSLAYPITKVTGDKTESFRFNLGTTF
ncbi:outer membrane protein assembly factor BamA [uncultured Candidatus Pelagibacter sp.]|uniref:outer membrane protein assembly factor BamA n=1 Tax=uncultured Candidatus Pelagibacter sp. TaxID=372654 RepID=UPI0026096AF9|nr:outer membrane protein assembly factor BamA [uncultured Candidatus Pelagibacter sp.]